MAQNRGYSSTTKRTTTTVDPGTSGTTLTVVDSTVFSSLDSSFPYTLLINWGLADQEIVNVTARPSGTTLTIQRGQDGTTGQTHAVGATVDHGVSARDFNEAGAHVGTLFGAHGSSFASKPSNTSITSNTTLADDSDLQLSVAANATYAMTSILKYEASTTGDISTQWVGPTGATAVGAVTALLSTATSDANLYVVGYALSDIHAAGGRGSGVPRAMQFVGTVTTAGTSGTMKLQWAQFASDSTATILYAGSYLWLQRVA